MKNILKTLIYLAILLAIGWFLYQHEDTIRSRFLPLLNEVVEELGIKSAPCENPIAYTLGTFDTKFGISQKYFLSAIADAEMIWEKPFGKELFVYNENDKGSNDLKINLIYDFRQQATSKLADLGIVVKDNRATYDALKIKFTELQTKLTSAKNEYNISVQSFNDKQKSYETQVQYWNAQGGAPKREYEQLQAEKSMLDGELSRLQAKQTAVNEMVTAINAVVVVLNRLATTLNISVDKYNTVGASRGESFEEGVYTSDGINEEIDIYEFSSRDKLLRVLAHELGHALGLGHVEDPKAIMYKLNQGSTMTLTNADLNAVKTRCGIK